jgi:hypothetical protein
MLKKIIGKYNKNGVPWNLFFFSFKAVDPAIRLYRIESLIIERLCKSKEQLPKPATETG